MARPTTMPARHGHGEAEQQHLLAAQPVRPGPVHQLQQTIRHHVPAERELHGGLRGAQQRGPFLHGGQADGHGEQAKRQLAQQIGNEQAVWRLAVGGWGHEGSKAGQRATPGGGREKSRA